MSGKESGIEWVSYLLGLMNWEYDTWGRYVGPLLFGRLDGMMIVVCVRT